MSAERAHALLPPGTYRARLFLARKLVRVPPGGAG